MIGGLLASKKVEGVTIYFICTKKWEARRVPSDNLTTPLPRARTAITFRAKCHQLPPHSPLLNTIDLVSRQAAKQKKKNLPGPKDQGHRMEAKVMASFFSSLPFQMKLFG